MRYRPTISDNVADIAQHEKRQDMAPMGPVTVRQGEKGVVLRSADGRRVLGGLGTMADGSMSLAVDVFGAVQDIRNPINANRESITYLDDNTYKKRYLDDAFAFRDRQITDNRSSITFLDIERKKLWDTATNHEKQIKDNRSSITYLDNVKASNAALGVANGRIDTVDRKADRAQSTADSAWDRANRAQSSANSAQSTANSAWDRAGSAQSSASSAWSRAGDAISSASSAHARANAAYDLAQAAYAKASNPYA